MRNVHCYGRLTVLMLGATYLLEGLAVAQQPVGLTEMDLIVHRDAARHEWYSKLPKLSQKASRVLLFQTGVVQVIANPNEQWQYRGNTRVLTPTPVEKDDYDKLSAILTAPEFVELYGIISVSPRFNAAYASMDSGTFLRKMAVQLDRINKLSLSPADKARFNGILGGIIADHPSKFEPEKFPDFKDVKFDEIMRTTKPRADGWKNFLLKPTEVPMAGNVQIEQALGRLNLLAAGNDHTVLLEPIQNAPTLFKVELGGVMVQPDLENGGVRVSD
jgi:hypothetical protein